ncbi:MAG: BrnT family toxin [Propionibacteriaceae bacterium]|nr:BrnT family toxin [Propionibacteriaceae bacterium]
MGGRDGGGEVGPADTSPLRFEWDPAKSASNKLKHGVDFEEANAMWRDGPDSKLTWTIRSSRGFS